MPGADNLHVPLEKQLIINTRQSKKLTRQDLKHAEQTSATYKHAKILRA
jgi:pterin-4a-carbinolamine dehydratase